MKEQIVTKTDWIVNVLIDLIQFSRMNDLPAIAEQLEEILDLALAETAAAQTRGKNGKSQSLQVDSQ